MKQARRANNDANDARDVKNNQANNVKKINDINEKLAKKQAVLADLAQQKVTILSSSSSTLAGTSQQEHAGPAIDFRLHTTK